MNWHNFTCLKVNNGLSLELVWPSWLDDEASAINGEGDRGHEAGEAGLVGLSHIKLSWCWLLSWVWLWLKLSCFRLCMRLTSSRTLANICSADEKCQIFSFRVLVKENVNTKNIFTRGKFWWDLAKRWLFVALARWCSWRHTNRHTSSSFWCASTRTVNWIKL